MARKAGIKGLGYRYNFKQYTHNMMYGIGIRL